MNPSNKRTSHASDFVATSPAHMSGKSEARIIGSAVAGISELALFHPVDTGTFYFKYGINVLTLHRILIVHAFNLLLYQSPSG